MYVDSNVLRRGGGKNQCLEDNLKAASLGSFILLSTGLVINRLSEYINHSSKFLKLLKGKTYFEIILDFFFRVLKK